MESSTSLQQAIHLIQTLLLKSNLSHSGDYSGRPSDCLSLGVSVLNSRRQVMINHILTIGLKVKQGKLETRKLQTSLQPSFRLQTACFYASLCPGGLLLKSLKACFSSASALLLFQPHKQTEVGFKDIPSISKPSYSSDSVTF